MIRLRSTVQAGIASSAVREAKQIFAALRQLGLLRDWQRLPIYIVAGPAGMGKSTLIQRSGLDYDSPLDLASSSWWIGEDALFAEIAMEPGREGGHPVFALLRYLRRVLPLSGVIMVVSPADLTLADVGERAEMSAAQVHLLRQFEMQFGYAAPVYLVVSKLDLTPGFAEFFDRLEPAEREQPWGFTLPVDLGRSVEGSKRTIEVTKARLAKSVTDRTSMDAVRVPITTAPSLQQGAAGRDQAQGVTLAYRTGFCRLLDSVRARVTQWISQETDVKQCERIVGFAAQVAALEVVLRPMIEPLMPRDKRRWQGAYLRGFYLTSSQQDALSIDALLPEMAKRFALRRTGMSPPDLGRDDETLGYFVEGLFRRVILPEAGLAQRNNIHVHSRKTSGWIAVAAVLAACAGLGLFVGLSFRQGVARIASIEEAVAEIGPALAATDPAGLPPIVAGLEAVASLRSSTSSEFLSSIVSLDVDARERIGELGRVLYARGVVNSLAPHLNARLARDLIRVDAPSDALRAAIAAADRATSYDAYVRWLQGPGSIGLAPGMQIDLSRGAAAVAIRLGAVPSIDPAYPTFARKVLSIREEAR